MKNKSIHLVVICCLVLISFATNAQYRAAATEVLENNGEGWIEKKLPPSVVIFSDFSGKVEIKTILSAQGTDSSASLQPLINDVAVLTMTLDKEQLPEQISSAKTYTSSGTLVINNISKKINVQYVMGPRNTGGGFTISVMIRFNPADFNIQMKGEPANEPLIVKVSSGYLNRQSNNF